jgi:hypothetical protein
LVFIGLHAPEFSFERIPANVDNAVKQMGLTYPIASDNNYSTWNAFSNQSWPTSYLINPKGQIVRVHSGEGEYSQEEDAIRQLLIANGANLSNMMVSNNVKVPVTANQTPETYLGLDKEASYEGTPAIASAPESNFTPQTNLSLNSWTLGGEWSADDQYVTSGSDTSTISIKVAAKNVYVVVGSSETASAKVLIDGKPINETANSGPDVHDGYVNFSKPGLYRIVSFPQFTTGDTVTMQVPKGVELNVYTFGS